jgi:hypothetical protein
LTYLINKPLLISDIGDSLLKPLNNEEIDKIMCMYSGRSILTDNDKDFKYHGTHPCDFYKDKRVMLNFFAKNKTHKINGIVLNTDTKDKDGEHWISIIINNRTKKIIFFDSFGRDPDILKNNDIKYILNYIKRKTGYKIIINKTVYQEKKSNHCGDYCVYYMMSYVKNAHVPLLSQDNIKIFRTYLWNTTT